jgi:hypothetical protein
MIAKLLKWAKIWIGVLLAIGVLELFAQLSTAATPRTLSELLARWFPKKWRRVLLVGLMSLLTWHFWWQADVRPVPVPITETP